jgi:hypothetical protein
MPHQCEPGSERMVRWLSPSGLFSTAMAVIVAEVFGKYSDKRELEGLQPVSPILTHGTDEDFWFDFVADLGDGWDSTYSVAWLLGQRSIEIEGRDYPRGDLLIMGGDEVYPRAGMERYRRRLVCPYQTARPGPSPHAAPLYAIPGNHDWYDGLTSFMRLFQMKGSIGDWYVPQTRSYFAARLPRRWWILGIDVAFDYYIDSAQLTYFRDLRFGPSSPAHVEEPRIGEGDNIILCTSRPGWAEQGIEGDIRVRKGELGRRALQELELEITTQWRCNLPLVLSGDLHHYAHYSTAGLNRHRITSGGGGAFLYLTHGLQDRVTWGSIDAATETLALEKEYPTKPRSRVLRHLVPFGPFLNPSFLTLVGVIHLLFASQLRDLIQGSRTEVVQSLIGMSPGDALGSLVTRPVAQFLALLVLVAMVAFADAGARVGWVPMGKILKGGVHASFHLISVLLSIAGAIALVTWFLDLDSGHAPTVGESVAALVLIAIVVALLGAFLGGLVMGLYLWFAHLLGAHGNDAFAALHMTGYKNFLRMRIDREGRLNVYAIGIDKVCTRWTQPPEREVSHSVPADPLVRHIIEEVSIPPG